MTEPLFIILLLRLAFPCESCWKLAHRCEAEGVKYADRLNRKVFKMKTSGLHPRMTKEYRLT